MGQERGSSTGVQGAGVQGCRGAGGAGSAVSSVLSTLRVSGRGTLGWGSRISFHCEGVLFQRLLCSVDMMGCERVT